MISLIIFILAVVSTTNIVIYESIFAPLQNYLSKYHKGKWFQRLLSCDACLGFWVGVCFHWLLPLEMPCLIEGLFVCGLISSICCKIFALYRLKIMM